MDTQGVALGLLGPDGEGPYLLKLEKERVRDELRSLPGGDALHDSEGWVLHQVLMHGLGDELQDHLKYVHDPEESWSTVVKGERQMAFFLKAFPLDLFRAVVGTGAEVAVEIHLFPPQAADGDGIQPVGGEALRAELLLRGAPLCQVGYGFGRALAVVVDELLQGLDL